MLHCSLLTRTEYMYTVGSMEMEVQGTSRSNNDDGGGKGLKLQMKGKAHEHTKCVCITMPRVETGAGLLYLIFSFHPMYNVLYVCSR